MQVSKAIITAMKEEADHLIKRYNLKETKRMQNLTIYEGEKKIEGDSNEKIILVLTGIGKIAATLGTTYLFENYIIDKLINIGIAGNLSDIDVKIGDVFLPNTFIQHDIYLPFDGEHLDYAKKPIFLEYAVGENFDLHKFGLILRGVCVTGDEFIDNKDKLAELRDEFGADIVDMEAFAILSVAREYKALDKCVVIKAVSDGADNDAKDAHIKNLDFAMQNSLAVLELVL